MRKWRNNTLIPCISKTVQPRGQEQGLQSDSVVWFPIPPLSHSSLCLLVSVDYELERWLGLPHWVVVKIKRIKRVKHLEHGKLAESILVTITGSKCLMLAHAAPCVYKRTFSITDVSHKVVMWILRLTPWLTISTSSKSTSSKRILSLPDVGHLEVAFTAALSGNAGFFSQGVGPSVCHLKLWLARAKTSTYKCKPSAKDLTGHSINTTDRGINTLQ